MTRPWTIKEGKNPILLVAGHNFPQVREHYLKAADSGTGSLAIDLSNKLETYGIISSKIQKDPNWYVSSPFRKTVKELIEKYSIKSVLDLHARRSSWPREIDFYPNNSYRKLYGDTLKGLSVRNFKDDEQVTLSEDLDQTHVPSLEVEIRSNMVIKNSADYDKIVSLLEKVVKDSLQV